MDTTKRTVVQPGDGYIKPGVADLSPEAGYVAATPYQFADENDETFKARLAMWESAKASAAQIAQGGATVAQKKEAAKARYDAEIANIDAYEKFNKGTPTPTTTASKKASAEKAAAEADVNDESNN